MTDAAEPDADVPKEQKAASVSVFNFSEIMVGKKAAEKAAAQQKAKAPDGSLSGTVVPQQGNDLPTVYGK